jgi:hypothetical protein
MLRILVAGCLLLVAVARPAQAEQWGTIVPGESTMKAVREQYGGPTRTSTTKTEGYDTAQWIYEGSQAPAGVRRLTLDFGLVVAGTFHGEIVRSFILEPKPGAFTRRTVTEGWGLPHGLGREGDSEFYFYREGLFVYFDKDGEGVLSMVFTPPQLPPPGKFGTPR